MNLYENVTGERKSKTFLNKYLFYNVIKQPRFIFRKNDNFSIHEYDFIMNDIQGLSYMFLSITEGEFGADYIDDPEQSYVARLLIIRLNLFDILPITSLQGVKKASRLHSIEKNG